MTAKTSEMLAQALDALKLDGLAEMARADMFHDFLSEFAMPEMELVAALRAAADACPDAARRVRIEDLRQDVIEGKYDASAEESEAWAASPEGQATFRKLFEKD